ncbi:MAG: PIN domain-containing protein [Candidatus Micrarchaeota archaeon]
MRGDRAGVRGHRAVRPRQDYRGDSILKKVVLDTNFLLLPYQFGVDIAKQIEGLLEAPHELVVPDGVAAELGKLAKGRGKEGAAARFALKFLEAHKVRRVRSAGDVDGWIAEYAEKEGAVVATNDAALRHKLKNAGVKVIVLRSRARLGMV